ncbi:MAG: glycosyltransferase family 2 protein [Patescibacteria group bacterium]|jgi:glycosyltransferase involved in cell wall biosynthesis
MESKISIIVPIYNEERTVAISLPRIFALPLEKEVIVIDDGSSDKTPEILAGLKSNYDFRLISQPINRGKGAAIRRGLEKISGDYFIICDADIEYDPADIVPMFKGIKEGAGRCALYGSRFLDRPGSSFHRTINGFLTGLTNLLFGSNLTDMETCFKLIPAAALKEIRLSGERFEIEPIITAQLLKNGYRIKEMPISYNRRGYKDGKKISPRDGLTAILALFKERLN